MKRQGFRRGHQLDSHLAIERPAQGRPGAFESVLRLGVAREASIITLSVATREFSCAGALRPFLRFAAGAGACRYICSNEAPRVGWPDGPGCC